jgi:uncharacterized protein (DUF1015 family)
MAKIKPFKAVRATRDKVALVTTRSYEIYNKKERNCILQYNPYSFLHILRPGYKFKKKVSGSLRFQMVYNRYNEFKENKIFIQDQKPGYYLHKKVFKNKVFWGFIGLASIEDYKEDIILKHEKTIHEREALFGNYLEVTGFNAEPVLITYPDSEEIQRIFEKYDGQRAEYEFTTNKERTHYLWLIQDQEELDSISRAFEKIPYLYIADGHHRTASSLYLYEKMKESGEDQRMELSSHFMAYFISESQLRISSFFRLIKSIAPLGKEEFLMRLDASFRIEKLGSKYYKPSKKHHFSMYLDGEYYKLYLRKSNYEINNVLDDLDAQVLHKTILEPILRIMDLSNDSNISYLPEIDNELKQKELVDSGEFEVAFGLYPVSVEQMKKVAKNAMIMPPKSTYVEPKLRSALTIYELM